MSTIRIPQAPVAGGAAARIRHETDDTGAIVAQFGDRIRGIGQAMETDRLDREMARSRIDLGRELGGARQEIERLGDPDEINRQWPERTAELRARLTSGADPRNRARVELAFDELADRHALALGVRAMDLASAERRVILDNHRESIVAGSVGLDRETREAALDQYVDSLADAVQAGDLDAEQANALAKTARDEAGRAVGLRMLDEDPAGLIAALDSGELGTVDPLAAEGLRARAAAAVASDAARAEAEAVRSSAERRGVIGRELGNVTSIARDGRRNPREAEMLADPEFQAHPDYPAFKFAIELRDELPGFATMTPDQQEAAVAAERARPVDQAFETGRAESLEATAKANREAWEADPIARASALLAAAPPALPDPASADPEALAEALTRRRDYGNALASVGYVDAPAYLSKAEREAFAAATALDQPPAARAALASTIVATYGPDAPRILAEIGGDEVFAHVGQLAAHGGDPAVVARAFQGQQLIEQKLVAPIASETRRLLIDEEFGDAFDNDRTSDTVFEGQIARVADSLYAARSRGVEPDSSEAERLYREALQEAAGGGTAGRNGAPVGGVRELRGVPTMLPVGIGPTMVEDGLERLAERQGDGATQAWAAASRSGGAPMYAGKPLTRNRMSDLKFRAVGVDAYVAYVEGQNGTRYDVTDSGDPDGTPFVFQLSALLREAAK